MKRIGLTLMAIVLLAGTSFVPRTRAETQPKVIEITAKRFEFAPNNITLKKGEPVVLRLTSQDVTHGFFVRALKVDELIPAGKTVEVKVQPEQVGTFTIICHHFCGAGHGNMKMSVTVTE